jgi:hypothetical protein
MLDLAGNADGLARARGQPADRFAVVLQELEYSIEHIKDFWIGVTVQRNSNSWRDDATYNRKGAETSAGATRNCSSGPKMLTKGSLLECMSRVCVGIFSSCPDLRTSPREERVVSECVSVGRIVRHSRLDTGLGERNLEPRNVFDSENAFAKAFRRVIGKAPKRYQRETYGDIAAN